MNINRSSMLLDNRSIGSGSCDNDAEFNDAIVSTARGGGIDAASAAVPTTDSNPVPADKDHNNLERKEEDTKRAVQFPFKLHSLLQQAEKEDRTDVVCWLPGGKAFKVFKKEEFCSDIMPRFFSSNKYKSFQRSLNLWGFESVVRGPDKGASSHQLFVRDKPGLCKNMTRVKIKGCASSPMIEYGRTSRVGTTSSISAPPPARAGISEFLRSRKLTSTNPNISTEANLLRTFSQPPLYSPNPILGLNNRNLLLGGLTQPLTGEYLLSSQYLAALRGSNSLSREQAAIESRARMFSVINTTALALSVVQQDEVQLFRDGLAHQAQDKSEGTKKS